MEFMVDFECYGLHNQRVWISAYGILVLILVVWVVSRSPAVNWIAWVLGLSALILTILSVIFPDPALIMWSSLLEVLLYFYAAGSQILN